MGGQVLIYNLIKTFPSIFHWAQAVPTKYRDRSHCQSWAICRRNEAL